MNSIFSTFRENATALMFLAKFIALYILMNTLYGLYIEAYMPAADPITFNVAHHSGAMLSIFYNAIEVDRVTGSHYMDIRYNSYSVINVFEGCNSINVMIVYLVFILSIGRQWYRHIVLIAGSLMSIYAINLLRVVVLFWIAYASPASLYFYHKFLFTGIIYAWVFLLWYFWLKRIKIIGERISTT